MGMHQTESQKGKISHHLSVPKTLWSIKLIWKQSILVKIKMQISDEDEIFISLIITSWTLLGKKREGEFIITDHHIKSTN